MITRRRSPSPPVPPLAAEPRDLDELTLARAKGGDASARATLIARYERPVFALLWRMVGSQRALVEDLAQETFLRALEALPRFDPHGSARLITWILTIATRLAIDHLRTLSGRHDAWAVPGGVPVALPLPDQDVDREALGEALVGAVEELAPPFRAAFLLREVHEMSYDEIAEALQIDIGTVKSRLSRARGLLQRALAELHDG
jgi:RNA polymerase sigma-70 factor (ECF subfamily)